MKGNKSELLKEMEIVRKFIIPVYQRNYDWKIENCKQLFDDLVDVINNKRENHFFGCIVSSCITSGRHGEYSIIDGQQRVTTVSLLLLAMHNLINEGRVKSQRDNIAEEILERYLIDKFQSEEKRIKLKPVKNDKSAYEKLFNQNGEKDEQSNLTQNYEYFYNRIQKDEVTIDALFDALFKLEIIEIQLDPKDDDAQMIFESLNSTGLALSEGDKIRNFILMGLDEKTQNEYYEKYWNQIEIYTNYNVSKFARDYLSIKLQSFSSMNNIYMRFKNFVKDNFSSGPNEDLLQDMLSYAKRYNILLYGNTSNKKLNACIYRLNRLETTVTRPFFLEILRMQEEGHLTEKEVLSIFLYTESYLFRRIICDIPTNALSKIFIALHREIFRYDETDKNYFEKFKYALISKSESGRFPNNKEFKKALETKEVYNMNGKNKVYMLERFNNFDTIEDNDVFKHIDEREYTIEHIMPQNLTPAWIEFLGDNYEEIHDTWLHRLANLTLTAYNSKYSNRTFQEKCNIKNGFKDSGIRLNNWIANQEKWTLDEIQERNKLLTEEAIKIWEYPETTYIPKEKQYENCSLKECEDLSGKKIISFSYKNFKMQSTNSWIDMFENVVRNLYDEDKTVLKKLAYNDKYFEDKRRFCSNDPKKLIRFFEIDKDIFIEKNTSTNRKIKILKELFDLYDISQDDLIFNLDNDDDNLTSAEV